MKNLDITSLILGDPFFSSRLTNHAQQNAGFPFYNIDTRRRKGVDEHRIHLALAGFNKDEIVIELEKNKLTIESEKIDNIEVDDNVWTSIHQGISNKDFKKVFNLAPNVVIDSADFNDGILTINMHTEVPEEEKPRLLSIN